MIRFILPYRTRIGALLKDHDEARTIFNSETTTLEKQVNKHTSDKCFMAFLVGVVISMSIFGGLFYYMYEDKNHGLTLIENAIRSK